MQIKERPLGLSNNPVAAATLLRNTFLSGRADQYKRELSFNSIQARATGVLFTALRWEEGGGLKRAIVDDGWGMGYDKIESYMGSLFAGESEVGLTGNFQMGARVSTLPINHYGVIIASWTSADDLGAMVWLKHDPEQEFYVCHAFPSTDEYGEETGNFSNVAEPPEWLRHPMIKEHGTVVVLLGNSVEDHTIFAFKEATGEWPTKLSDAGSSQYEDIGYLNSKYWAHPNVEISVHTPAKNSVVREWGGLEAYSYISSEVCHRRLCNGVDQVLNNPNAGAIRGKPVRVGQPGAGALVHWAFVDKLPDGKSHVPLPSGLFGELYQNEIYNIHNKDRWAPDPQRPMEYYGIAQAAARSRMVLIIEPDTAVGPDSLGPIPTLSRDRLILSGRGGQGLPHRDWGREFAEKMPDELVAQLRRFDESEKDQYSERRLSEARKLIAMMMGRRLLSDPHGKLDADEGVAASEPRQVTEVPKPRERAGGTDPDAFRTGNTTRKSPVHGSPIIKAREAVRRDDRTINPSWSAAEFIDQPWRIAHYVPSARSLVLNPNHEIVLRFVELASKGRRLGLREQVQTFVREVIADHLCATILAAESYSSSALARGRSDTSKFEEMATSDDSLLLACFDFTALEKLISNKFRGRAGFARKEEDEDVA